MAITFEQFKKIVELSEKHYEKGRTLEYELNETTAAVVHGLTENDRIPTREAQE